MVSRFRPEPLGQPLPDRTGILLCNLGTPDAPTTAATRRYLAEFLSDQRVVEIPALVWKPILHGVILRTRPAKSAAKYRSVWMPEGSPLAVWTDKQAKLLRGSLGEAGHQVLVRPAMRYGNPSIASQLDAFKAEGVRRVLVLPLYPQYSATTTASVVDAVNAWCARARDIPEIRFVRSYHRDPGYIKALAQSVRKQWQIDGRAPKLVMSFHGIPERNVRLGDPYQQQSQETAQLLAAELGLAQSEYLLTFQSRFGKAKWLEPYTEPSLIALAQQGLRHVQVMCPGFPADCLETLEEINQEVREAFVHAGGQQFDYIACLNDQPSWIAALRTLALQHLQGWDTGNQPAEQR
ncbi:ferrochelatase [Comamonas sp. BIGb0152]|uniref:ferrochelatase n=1 Tax=Comamonas sp. BIGb0152 TaxID=2940601 RepID=UPI002168188E|nr:ferrochelatase [Comamonas sp. BIGb0152]MCS4295374.1 ferrochelatase [Comamonas sp. BIGb0152]